MDPPLTRPIKAGLQTLQGPQFRLIHTLVWVFLTNPQQVTCLF